MMIYNCAALISPEELFKNTYSQHSAPCALNENHVLACHERQERQLTSQGKCLKKGWKIIKERLV